MDSKRGEEDDLINSDEDAQVIYEKNKNKVVTIENVYEDDSLDRDDEPLNEDLQ